MLRLHNNEIVTRLPANFVAAEKPILKSLPSNLRWLVLKGHFFLDPDRNRLDIQNQISLVTLLDKNGNILDNMEDQVVQHNVVYKWMSGKSADAGTSAKNVAKLSRVFLAIPNIVQIAPSAEDNE